MKCLNQPPCRDNDVNPTLIVHQGHACHEGFYGKNRENFEKIKRQNYQFQALEDLMRDDSEIFHSFVLINIFIFDA